MRDAIPTLAAAVQAALSRGAPDEAQVLCERWLALAPNDANAWLFSGIAAHRGNVPAKAVAALQRSATLASMAFQPRYWLGVAAMAAGDHAVAEKALEEALSLAPGHADTAYNLGLALVRQARHDQAGRLFVAAGRATPKLDEAFQQVVECAATLARAQRSAPAATPKPMPGEPPFLSFIVCSIDATKLTRLRSSLIATFAPGTYELVHIGDARSLYDGFLRGTAMARSDLLVYCHDDIELLAPDFQSRLLDALDGADLVGVCGTTRVTGPAVAWTGSPEVHGWMTHLHDRGGFLPSISSLAPARIDGAQAIDGVFLATRRHVVDALGFDADRFDGFHLYDLDFSYRAFRAGYRLRIQNDLTIVHASLGQFEAAYWRYAKKFLAKHPELCAVPHGATAFYQCNIRDAESLRRFYGWIAHWLGER